MGEPKILHYTLPKAKPQFHILGQEGIKISFSQEDPTVEIFPTHIERDEGNKAVTCRAHPLPHEEDGGEHAPIGGILVLLQEGP